MRRRDRRALLRRASPTELRCQPCSRSVQLRRRSPSQFHCARPRPGRPRPSARAAPRRRAARRAARSSGVAIAPADDVAGLALAHRLRRPARIARHHRQPGRRRLEVDHAQALDVQAAAPGAARHREHVAGRVVLGQLRVRHPAGEHDVFGDPVLVARARAARRSYGPDADEQQRGVRAPPAAPRAAPRSAGPAPCAGPAATRRRSPDARPARSGRAQRRRPRPAGTSRRPLQVSAARSRGWPPNAPAMRSRVYSRDVGDDVAAVADAAQRLPRSRATPPTRSRARACSRRLRRPPPRAVRARAARAARTRRTTPLCAVLAQHRDRAPPRGRGGQQQPGRVPHHRERLLGVEPADPSWSEAYTTIEPARLAPGEFVDVGLDAALPRREVVGDDQGRRVIAAAPSGRRATARRSVACDSCSTERNARGDRFGARRQRRPTAR